MCVCAPVRNPRQKSREDDSLSLSVVDLYAGAGGLSLGFAQSGFQIAKAVEIDGWAVQTYRSNLGDHIVECSVADFISQEANQYTGVDVLIGGPPCQGFSISARSRLETANDSRNEEVKNFVLATKILSPKYVIFENVPQFGSFQDANGKSYGVFLKDALEALGYFFSSGVLDATDFGVPQNRKRFIAIGIQTEATSILKHLHSFLCPKEKGTGPVVSSWEAISDLPTVEPRTLSEDAILSYAQPPQNDYQREMRIGSEVIHNHVPMRHTPRLVERFKKIEPGKKGVDVWSEAAPRKRSNVGAEGTRFDQNHRRMDPDRPSPTITAHMYSTCLHPFQHRNITVREAARLQSFPDMFRFFGKRTTLSKKLLERKGLHEDAKLSQLNQVGNAVPPRLARGIAEFVLRAEGVYHADCA